MTHTEFVMMLSRNDIKCFREDVLPVDLLVVELYRLPGWVCEGAGDEDGRSRAMTLIGDRYGRVGHDGQRVKSSAVEGILVAFDQLPYEKMGD